MIVIVPGQNKQITNVRQDDFVDSIYTSAGKINGCIYYPNFIEYISTHPLMEMFLSPQFQGSMREKMFSHEEIEKLDFNNH